MKRLSTILLTFAVAICCLASSLLLVACGSQNESIKVKNVYVKSDTLDTKINIGEELDTSRIVLVLQLSNKLKYEIEHDKLTIDDSAVDTSKAGEYVLKISYEEKVTDDLSVKDIYNQKIIVRYPADAIKVNSMSSDLLTDYTTYSGERPENNHEEFKIKRNYLMVGDDNEFNFRISATGLDDDGELVENLDLFRTIITVKLNGQELTGEDLARYVTIDDTTTTFDFTDAAIAEVTGQDANGRDQYDKVFHIMVEAANPADGYRLQKIETDLVVVDGYNVYNARQLSVYDNSESHSDWYAPIKAAEGLTNVTPSAIVLQKDIFVTKNDVPEEFFWGNNEGDQSIIDTVKSRTGVDITGTPKDWDGDGIYRHELTDGQHFNFYGNYFSVNAKDFPLIKLEGLDADNAVVRRGEMITAHMNLFYNQVYGNVTKKNTEVNFKNISFIGNSALSNDSEKSGGLLMTKSTRVNFNAKNTINQNFYIGYFMRCTESELYDDFAEDGTPVTGESVIEDCKAYDAYQDLLYSWGGNHIIIRNCEFINAGGPAIIADCVHKNSNKMTETPEFVSKLDIINSTIESQAVGTEPWYNFYAPGVVGQIVTNDSSLFGDSNVTMVANKLSNNVEFIDIKVLMKGRKVDINNAVNMGDSYTRFFASEEEFNAFYDQDNPQMTTYGLDFGANNYYGSEGNLSRLASAQQAMAIFQNAGNGAFISSSINYEENGVAKQHLEPAYISMVGCITKAVIMEQVFAGAVAAIQSQMGDVISHTAINPQTTPINETVDHLSNDFKTILNTLAIIPDEPTYNEKLTYTLNEIIKGAYPNFRELNIGRLITIDEENKTWTEMSNEEKTAAMESALAEMTNDEKIALIENVINHIADGYDYKYSNGRTNGHQYLNLYMGQGIGVVLGLYTKANA